MATSRRVVEELMLMMLAAGGKFVKEVGIFAEASNEPPHCQLPNAS